MTEDRGRRHLNAEGGISEDRGKKLKAQDSKLKANKDERKALCSLDMRV